MINEGVGTFNRRMLSMVKRVLSHDRVKNIREQRVRTMAYRLWEEAGRPWGREEEFWLAAEQKYEEERQKLYGALPEPVFPKAWSVDTSTEGTNQAYWFEESGLDA